MYYNQIKHSSLSLYVYVLDLASCIELRLHDSSSKKKPKNLTGSWRDGSGAKSTATLPEDPGSDLSTYMAAHNRL